MNGKRAVIAALVFFYIAYGAYGYAGDVRSRMNMHLCPPGVAPAYVDGAFVLPECPTQTIAFEKEWPAQR